MNEMTVGTRELKNKLSEYLRRVKAGETIVITERGNEVAWIIPKPETLEDRMKALAASGFLEWSGKKLKPHKPTIINTSGRQISDLIVEDRR
ncbi:MAG: prevent-host-death protein [Anaerolineae bacterium CG03_land_8_20_14_0_80_58_20]|nr:MAG: prevent-host-death protein [Anaerolineae bacterium CG03_land_8_20_14_0_80_58_20]